MTETKPVVALVEGSVRPQQLLSRQTEEKPAQPERPSGGSSAATRRRGGTTAPPPMRVAAPRAHAARAGRGGLPGARGSWQARPRRPPPGSSASMASICSTNSGFPSAARTMRVRSAGSAGPSSISPSTRSSESSSLSGASETRLARGRGAAHDGLASKRSGRARQRSRIGAPLEKPRTYSSRSSSVESAQWMSSTATTRGREAASVSRSRRNAHAVSSGDPGSSLAPIAPRTRRAATSAALHVLQKLQEARLGIVSRDLAHDLGERQVGDSLAVGDAAPDDDARVVRSREAITSRARRDLPIPGGPTTVASAHEDSRAAVSKAWRSTLELSWRPTKGVAMERVKAGASGRRPSKPPGSERLGSCPSRRPGTRARRRRRRGRGDRWPRRRAPRLHGQPARVSRRR